MLNTVSKRLGVNLALVVLLVLTVVLAAPKLSLAADDAPAAPPSVAAPAGRAALAVEINYLDFGSRSMEVGIYLRAKGLRGENVGLGTFFLFSNNRGIPASSAAPSTWILDDGSLGYIEFGFIPLYDDTEWVNITLQVPYSYFDFSRVTRRTDAYVVVVGAVEGYDGFVTSDPEYFTVSP
jgi:hypothetical protein